MTIKVTSKNPTRKTKRKYVKLTKSGKPKKTFWETIDETFYKFGKYGERE